MDDFDRRARELLANPAIRELLEAGEVREVIERQASETMLGYDGEKHRFYTWRPEPKLKYQNEFFLSEASTLALIGANQIGKTMCGSRWVASHLVGFDPLYPQRKFEKGQLVWACTEPSLLEGLFEEILRMIPPSEIKRKSLRRSPGRLEVEVTNGLLQMKSFELPREGVQQAKCTVVWWDEEGPLKHWLELQIRLAARGGKMLITLTPVKGTSWLHTKLRDLDPKYYAAMSGPFAWFTASILDNPHISPEKLAEIIKDCQHDPDMYAIRVLGEYRKLSGSNVFSSEALSWQTKNNVRPPLRRVIFDNHGNAMSSDDPIAVRIYEEPSVGHVYAGGIDVASGDDPEKNDFSAITIVRGADNAVVATWHGRIDPDTLGYLAYFLGLYYNEALLCVEVNRMGGGTLGVLRSTGYPNIYRRVPISSKLTTKVSALGFDTNGITKPQMVMDMKRVVNTLQTAIPCAETLQEMSNYQQLRVDTSINCGFGAAVGHDDRVAAFGLAIQATKQISAFEIRKPRNPLGIADPRDELNRMLRLQVTPNRRRKQATWW